MSPHSLKNKLPNQQTWLRIAPLLVLALVWLISWWPVITGQAQLFIRDLTFYALPMKSYMMERLQQGEFPFWTPYIGGGAPFFADPTHQVLYPFNLLFLIAPSLQQGISWFIILHLFLALLAFYTLCRTMGFHPFLSGWGAFIYGFSGYVVSISDNVNYLPATMWLPLSLTCLLRGFTSGAWHWVFANGACIAMMLLAGDTLNPSFLCFAWLVLALIRFKNPAFYPGISPRKGLWQLATTILVTLLLSAVQLLPALELADLSVRQKALPFDEITLWSFPPQRLIEFIQPYFYGSKYPKPHFLGMFLYPKFREPWVDSVYIGFIPVLLAAIALFQRPKQAIGWGIITVVALLIGFGGFNPYFETMLQVIKPLNHHRYLEKLVLWATLAISILAVTGAQACWEQPLQIWERFQQKSLWAKLAWSLGFLMLGSILLVKIPSDLWIWPHARERSEDWGRYFYHREPHLTALYLHWLLLSVLLVLLPWLKQQWQKPYFAFLLCFAALDLGLMHGGHTPTQPTAMLHHTQTPVAASLIQQDHPKNPIPRILYDDRVELRVNFRNQQLLNQLTQAYQTPVVDSHTHYWLYRMLYSQNRLLFNYGVLSHLRYLNGRYEPLQQDLHKRMEHVLNEVRPALLPQLCSVDYIITTDHPISKDYPPSQFREVGRNHPFNVRVLAPKSPLPRAYLAPNALWNPESGEVFKMLTAAFNTADLTEQVELNAPPPANAAKNRIPVHPHARVRLLKDNFEHLTFTVFSPYPKPAYLVVSESWFPGWEAKVDGKKAPLYLANQRFMGLPISPGAHQVELRYHSTRFNTGLAISLLTLLMILGVGLQGWRKRP